VSASVGLVAGHARLVTRHPLAVVAVTVLLAALAWRPARELPIRAGRLDMAPARDPTVALYREFNRTFGAVHTVYLLVSGPPARLRPFADAAAVALAAAPGLVRAVAHRLDPGPLVRKALADLSPREAEELAGRFERVRPLVETLIADPSPARLLSFMADDLGEDASPPPPVTEVIAALRLAGGVATAVEEALAGRTDGQAPVLPDLASWSARLARMGLDPDGYLVARDGSTLLLLISPVDPPDDPDSARRLLAGLEARLAPVVPAFPGVRVALGGAPVQDVQEQETVARDMRRTSLVAAAGVLALSVWAFASIPTALIANLVLALAVFLTLAATKLFVGHLNTISSVFVAIVLGTGIDFGIYLMGLYSDALPLHGERAMEHALVTGMPGIVTGGVTPAAAFYSLMLHEFRAFRELGLIAGTGLLISLIAMLTVLPALVVLLARRLGPGAARPRPVAAPRILVRASAATRWVLLACAPLMLLAAAGAARVRFEYDLTRLQAPSSAAIQSERTLRREFGLSSDFVMVRSRSLADARRASAALASHPEVGRVDSVSAVASELDRGEDPAVARILAWSRGRLPVAPAPAPARAPALVPVNAGHPALSDAVAALRRALPAVRSLAAMTDSTELAREATDLDARLDRLGRALAGAPPAAIAAGLAGVSRRIAADVSRFVARLAAAAAARPHSPSTLPPELSARYVGRDGSFATYAWPSGELSKRDDMVAFVEAARSAAPGDVAGIPIMVSRMLDMIRAGFPAAGALALAAILVAVALDLRRPALVAFALLPMASGTVIAVALLGWSGSAWNPVNCMALPVMIGEGVGFGVNMVHRWLADRSLEAVARTARAVVFCAATSIVGFGSLALAEHRGLASFGQLMAAGTFAELVVCALVLPAVLSWAGAAGSQASVDPVQPDPAP
jgi:predicted RND superfamily exporter protein